MSSSPTSRPHLLTRRLPPAFATLLLFAPLAVWAQASTAPTAPAAAAAAAPAPLELGAGIGQMLFGLAVVLALLIGTLWLLKRLTAPRGGGHGLKVLAAASVGARERVVLVEVADTVLVLGVAQGSVRALHTLPSASLSAGDTGSPPTGPVAEAPNLSAFAARFRQSLERRTP